MVEGAKAADTVMLAERGGPSVSPSGLPPPRSGEDYPTEQRVFDYIYGVLHSPDYCRTYQPAQKWLKDRIGRALSFDDVMHYQKIIKILRETDRIMKEIILPL